MFFQQMSERKAGCVPAFFWCARIRNQFFGCGGSRSATFRFARSRSVVGYGLRSNHIVRGEEDESESQRFSENDIGGAGSADAERTDFKRITQ
jgi:hypothetical protein